MMKNLPQCVIQNQEVYLNNVLLDLPYQDNVVVFELKGRIFKAYPENAKQFLIEYSEDIYSQLIELVNVDDVLKGLFDFMNRTGDIIEEAKDL